ncbi:exodeoxyribonuclease VII small subunit [Chrysiogenes arsenatis]|uniref:exodeoxyribonuclease VII small subunit n=1 Tax=Chrysiogenes arsenatis TaxID=309797 RepID=UPI000400FF4A|nr:exodeoxyribonuclease VII small subunit [Chrysiogenes arsenatis]
MKFEDKIARLEALSLQMEQGEIPLEESLTLYEEGMRLLNECEAQLQDAQGKIQLIKDGRAQAYTPPHTSDEGR